MRVLLGYMPITFPTIYDYALDMKRGVWMPWQWLLPVYLHDREKNFSDILVQTIDTVRTTWFMNLMNDLQRPVLLIGETGTSKTAIVHDFLKNLHTERYVSKDKQSIEEILTKHRNVSLVNIDLF